MSSHPDQGVSYLWNLMVGFAVFVLFGVGTFLIFQVGSLKKPTDRVMEGDFSADQTALRLKNLEEVRLEQAGSVKTAQLDAALKNFKAPAAAPTEVVVPGSPTSLKAAAAAAPAPTPENPPAESKTPPAGAPKEGGPPEAPSEDKGKAEAPKGDSGEGKGAVKGKGKAPAEGKVKGPAKGKGPAKAKGN